VNFFTPPPAGPAVAAADVPRGYGYWRWRQLYATFIGYAVFYFVRKNLSCAMPLIERDLHISKAQLGGYLSAHGILYGVSKFVNGMAADRCNARSFMVVGLITSALVNIFFGFSSGVWTLGLFWVLNGWFQGMGFPPCARILSHWFSRSERGVKWGLWNTSHQVGGALILMLGGYLGQHYGWRWVFWGPAVIALVISLFLWNRLRDTPASLGLPEVEEYTGEPLPEKAPLTESFSDTLRRRVFTNPYIWAICFANFFVYVVRYVYFDWWPTYLHQARGFSLGEGTRLTALFEIAGLVGSLAAGYLSDRWLGGKRNPVCLGYLLATGICIAGYWYLPPSGFWAEALALGLIGFFIYGPQFLVGVMVTDLASKEAAASAIGLTGFFGYLSGVVSGWGLGWLVDHYGWGASFIMTLTCTVGALLCFAVCGRKA